MRKWTAVALGIVAAAAAVGAVAVAGPTASTLAPKAGKTKVLCVSYDRQSGEPRYTLRKKPRKCTFLKRGEKPFGYTTVDMVKIRWQSWGGRKARGKGKFVVNMTGPVPGRVVLVKPKGRCGGARTYTQARFIDGQSGERSKMPLDGCHRGVGRG